MNTQKNLLLLIDGIVNLILGVLLLLFPFGIADLLGVPYSGNSFYPTILGSVLFGIGLALLIERFNTHNGLGILGAIVINLCGSAVLLIWLISNELVIPLRGSVILWSIAVIVFLIGIFELISRSWMNK